MNLKKISDNMLLPFGKEVGLFSDVQYSVPGLFLFSKLIYDCMDLVSCKLGYDIPVKFIYGSAHLKWNSGRLILNTYGSDFSLNGIAGELMMANKRGIIPLLTFSNTVIKSDDFKDRKCNYVLNILNEIGGGVILYNCDLKHYIEEKYSNISIHGSVILSTFEKNRNFEYYKKLSDEYKSYIIHPDDNFDYDLLEKLPKKNAVILINERCYYKCKKRREHYMSISREQIALIKNSYKDSEFLNVCKAIPEIKQSSSRLRNISLTISEIKKLNKIGYNFFKLQGRTDDLFIFFFDFLRYTLNNDMIFPNIYTIFSFQINKFKKETGSD